MKKNQSSPLPEVEARVLTLAGNVKAFAPRLLVKLLGIELGDATALCKRAAGRGLLERVEVEGEFYFRQPQPKE